MIFLDCLLVSSADAVNLYSLRYSLCFMLMVGVFGEIRVLDKKC